MLLAGAAGCNAPTAPKVVAQLAANPETFPHAGARLRALLPAQAPGRREPRWRPGGPQPSLAAHRRHKRTIPAMSVQGLLPLPGPAADPVVGACPVGSRIDTVAGRWGLGTATFDSARRYRFRLSRVWDPGGTRVNFLMLNPSTADAFELDPTVRRCIGFARAWGAGALGVTNAYALRATDPAELRSAADPVGAGNDEAIVAAALAADLVVVAWGVHAVHLGREAAVRALLAGAGISAHYLRLTKDGHPGHPLYLPADTDPTPWRQQGA